MEDSARRIEPMLKFIFLPLAIALVSGCGSIGAFVMAKHATCKVKVNNRFVGGSCSLNNGVIIEKLNVIQSDSLGIPQEYFVTQRIQCAPQWSKSTQPYTPKKIYFYKPNLAFKWTVDTVQVLYRVKGNMREQISVQMQGNYNPYLVKGFNKYDSCPLQLEKNTWYALRLTDQRLRIVYLFIDSKGKFHIEQVDSGVSPV